MCAHYGADAIGLRIRPKLNLDKAKQIVKALPPFVTPVVLINKSEHCNAEYLSGLCDHLGVSTFQVYPEIALSEVTALQGMRHGIKIIKALAVMGGETLQYALEFQPYYDGLLLDSEDPKTGQIGGTGFTHDWSISKQIVESLNMPVIIAGGLNPSNVKSAIQHIQPWGVDCETGVEKSDGIKDYQKVDEFIKNSRSAL